MRLYASCAIYTPWKPLKVVRAPLVALIRFLVLQVWRHTHARTKTGAKTTFYSHQHSLVLTRKTGSNGVSTELCAADSTRLRPSSVSNEECPVCHTPLREAKGVNMLPCAHLLCVSCTLHLARAKTITVEVCAFAQVIVESKHGLRDISCYLYWRHKVASITLSIATIALERSQSYIWDVAKRLARPCVR